MSPVAKKSSSKKGGPRKVKESGSGKGEITIEVKDGQLQITWFCGGVYKWTPQAAREQYARLLMFPGHFERIWMSDRATAAPGYYSASGPYACRIVDGKFYANDHAGENGNEGMGARSVSWAQFNKALAAAIQELPAATTEG